MPQAQARQPGKLESYFRDYHTNGPLWTPEECAAAASAHRAALDMAADMRDRKPGWTLSLIGQTSCGKTFLALLLLRFWNRHLARPIARKLDWQSHDWRQVEDEKDSPFLVLDEIGRARPEWPRFMELLNYRIERRLFTVLTSNLTYDEIKSADPSIASRLRRNNGRAIQFPGSHRPFEDRNSPAA